MQEDSTGKTPRVESLRAVIRRIEWFIERGGMVLRWFVVAFVLTMAYEVISRYVFNAPTVWSYDISYMLGGGMIVLGGAYLIYRDGHVRIDIIYGRLSPRKRLIVDMALWLVFFLPMVLILTDSSFHYAVRAWKYNEVSAIWIWRPPLFPFKATIFVAWCLVLLEGVCWFVKDLLKLVTGEET